MVSRKEPVSLRTLAVALLVAAAFVVPISALLDPNAKTSNLPVSSASAEQTFVIGKPDIYISTLNPFMYTTTDEYMVVWPCMSTLLTYDPDQNIIGDLAAAWTVSADGLTWTFELANNAYFVLKEDPTGLAHPVTADDVLYSLYLVQNYSHSLHYLLPGGSPDESPPTISRAWKLSTYELAVQLREPYAPFAGALAAIPIVPKFYWEPLVNSAGSPDKISGALPIGSGPWYYALSGLPTTGEVVMKRNPTWFQEANKDWHLNVDVLRIKGFWDSALAFNALKTGVIDCMMNVPPSVYIDEIASGTYPDIIGFAQSTGFVYEYNLNQMSTDMRAALVKAGLTQYRSGTNSQILLDPVVKKALAMSVDRETFVAEVMLGLGSPGDSLVPDTNPWHYAYGSSPGDEPYQFNPLAARQMLWDTGWKYDSAGREVSPGGTQVPLYGYCNDVLTPLSFRFATLSDPDYFIGGLLIRSWAAQAGIQLNLYIVSMNQMTSIWYTADYDLWLWNWIFTPFSDPSTEVLSVLTTMEIGDWSDVFYHNAIYDDLYNQSVREMDPVARRALTDQMQRMIYEDGCCQAVAYKKDLYAVSTKRWSNYGDWSSQVSLLPDQGFPYLYMRIEYTPPVDLMPPVADAGPDRTVYSGAQTTLDGSRSYDDIGIVEYVWTFEAGGEPYTISTESPVVSMWIPALSHPGVYEITLTVKDAAGNSDSDSFVLTVIEQPIVIVKSPGSGSNPVSWEYEPLSAGWWNLRIENSGLKSMVLEVYDVTDGASSKVFKETIHFKSFDAYPSGTAYSTPFLMEEGHVYKIVAKDFNGPSGSQVVIWTQFVPL